MRRTDYLSCIGCLVFILATISSGPVNAASHQWRFNEIFSNEDGTVQFIEMKECCGFTSETTLIGKWILTVDAATHFDFPQDLTGNTANKYLLLATQGFVDLPGAPTPDFIIPDNFIPTGDDTLEYWMYIAAVWSYSGLPTDGTMSLNRDGSTGVNSPTNFAGDTGSVDTVPVTGTSWGATKTQWSIPY